MLIINTASDLTNATSSPERTAFLTALLNDDITFDDAEYAEGYDRKLQEGEEGYMAPVLRLEWNAAAAAAWGFSSREQIKTLQPAPTALIRARRADGTFISDDPATPGVDEAWVTP